MTRSETLQRPRIGMAALAGAELRATLHSTIRSSNLLKHAAEKYGLTWMDADEASRSLGYNVKIHGDVIVSMGDRTVIVLDLQGEDLVWRTLHLLGHVACGHWREFDPERLHQEAEFSLQAARLMRYLEIEADVFALTVVVEVAA
ncbi:MAG: hypothetical protein ACYC9Q_05505 [Bacillota bacterium]